MHTQTRSKTLPSRLAVALLLCAVPLTVAADGAAATAAPSPPDYSLVLPYNLPHLMQFIGKIGLSDAEKSALDNYANETVRPALRPLLEEAQRLEKEIGRAALDGQTRGQLAAKLDRLQRVKREAAEIHIDCVNRVKAAVGAERYGRLLKTAQP